MILSVPIHSSVLNTALMPGLFHLKFISRLLGIWRLLFHLQHSYLAHVHHQKHLREEVFCYIHKIHLKLQIFSLNHMESLMKKTALI